MNGDENKIIDILRRFWGRGPNKTDRMHCPDEETLTQFLAGNLKADKRGQIEAHLAECSLCAEELVAGYKVVESGDITRVRQWVIDRAMALVPAKEYIFDVAVRLMRDAIEIIGTSGRVVPLPRPVVRGEAEPVQSNALQVEQEVGRFKIAVEIDLNGTGTCQLTANVSEESGTPADGVRLTLTSDDREQASFLTRAGVVVFDRIAPGEYSIAVSEFDTMVGKIRLNLMLER